jgi:ABC-type Fe3+ transport system substrate-binding protein
LAAEIKGPGKILIFLIGLGLLAYAGVKYGWFKRFQGSASTPAGSSATEQRGSSKGQVKIDFLYTTEKEAWLKAAVEDFQKKEPNIAVNLQPTGSIESVRTLSEGTAKPTIWSPADEAAINLLDTEWTLARGRSLIEKKGDLAPQPLVLTPLVVIAWEERAKLLSSKGEGPADFKTLHSLATSPKGWMSVGGPSEWGYVKLGHTAPNSSNSGLQTLILMAYSFTSKRANLRPADILDDKFQKWMKEIETAVGKFGNSSGTYMKEMVLYGPSKYDIIFNYESVAIGYMAAAEGRWGSLSVFYPNPTLWSNHPLVFFSADWITPEQQAAARKLRDFLLSQPVQERAMEFGFRPANPDVKVLSSDPANPWNRLKTAGIRVDVPPVAEAPSGEVTRLLLETWRRVVEAPGR